MNANTKDPRIGQLCREGRAVFYAFIDGDAEQYVEGTEAEVIAALAGQTVKPAPAAPMAKAKKARVLKRYEVHQTFKTPAWDEHKGYYYEVSAYTKAEANKRAREKAYHDGYTHSYGVMYFKAREIKG